MATKSSTDATSIELAAFEFALKTVESACGALPTFILSSVTGKKGTSLQLSGASNGSEAVFRLPGQIKNLDAAIEIPRDAFADAVKGRKQGSLVLKSNSLVIKAGAYEATINVSEAPTVPEVSVPEGTDDYPVSEITLTPEIHEVLSRRLPAIKIDKAHAALPDVMMHLKVDSKQLYMAAFDTQNFCFMFDKSPLANVDPFELHLPYTRFATFIKDLPVANCKVYTTPDAVIAVSGQFRLKIALPAIDADSAIDVNAVLTQAKALRKASGSVLTIKQVDLVKFMDNARALVSVGTDVQFKRTDSGTVLSVTSARGSVKTKLKSTGETKDFGLIYAFVQTLMSKIGKKPKTAEGEDDPEAEVAFEIVNDSMCVCRSNVIYAALLSADNSEGSGDE